MFAILFFYKLTLEKGDWCKTVFQFNRNQIRQQLIFVSGHIAGFSKGTASWHLNIQQSPRLSKHIKFVTIYSVFCVLRAVAPFICNIYLFLTLAAGPQSICFLLALSS